MLHPVGERADIFVQAHGCCLRPKRQCQSFGQRLSSASRFRAGHFVSELVPRLGAAFSPVFQVKREFAQFSLGVKHIAVTSHTGPGSRLPGAKPAPAVGDRVVRGQALVEQFQQAHAPRRLVAVIFNTQQVAIRRIDIGADQHGLAALEDFVVGPHANVRQVLPIVNGT